MTTRLQDFAVATVGALVFLLLGWGWARAVRRGRPLTALMRKMLTYGFLFMLGLAYIMMFGSWFAWPKPLWFILTAIWGGFLGLVAWLRRGRRSAQPLDSAGPPPLNPSDPLDLQGDHRKGE